MCPICYCHRSQGSTLSISPSGKLFRDHKETASSNIAAKMMASRRQEDQSTESQGVGSRVNPVVGIPAAL